MRTPRGARTPMDPGVALGGTGEGWKQPRDMVPCPGWGSATSSPSRPSPIALQIAGQAVACPEKRFLSRSAAAAAALLLPKFDLVTPKKLCTSDDSRSVEGSVLVETLSPSSKWPKS